MKRTILSVFFLFSFFFTTAQKELWGNNKIQSYIDYSDPTNPITLPYYGNITKYDINGDNGTVVHVFDGINGKLPTGKLFHASNGKLYGLTSAYTSSTGLNDDVCLFEYDLILNKFRILHTFDHTIYYSQYMTSGVIEGVTGKLYGAIGTHFFCYTIDSETTTMHSLNNYYADLKGELVKASDNFLYGCAYFQASCPATNSVGAYQGIILKINTINNTSQIKYFFNCDTTDGTWPSGSLIETSTGILTGSTKAGGGVFYNSGTLFEYNINTNTFTKKHTFDGENIGSSPQAMVNGNNGKLYGVCSYGGSVITPPNNFIDYLGSLFEYTPTTNIANKLLSFPNDGFAVHPTSIMKASTGLLFGVSDSGIFRYNPIDNSFILPNFSQPVVTEPLIEICRKPTYQEFIIDTFNPCVGENFTFNVQNTNATSYIWKKNNIDLPTQNSGILNLVNVTTNDNGIYTCQMVKECGTTVTMPLQLTVDCLGTDDFIQLNKVITLFPNPAKNILNIKIYENSNLEISKIEITNLLGQIVFSEEKSNTKIDVSKFQSGIYQIKIITNKGSWNKKFIKE